MKSKIIILCPFILILSLSPCLLASNQDDPDVDLTQMSIEDLMDIEVSVVAKKSEKLSDAAAAVYVLTGDEIKKSGVRTIPDALRLVPGMHVANIDGSTWAVTARGFNSGFSNKLLVMIDGRSVYSPLLSNIWWDTQDIIIDNIDRIEVIRGPGATLWGANAVNGVVNIITKKPESTQQAILSLGAGSYERSTGNITYNCPIGDNGALRVYGKYFDRDNYSVPPGNDYSDQWDMGRGGFQFNQILTISTEFNIQADFYQGEANSNYSLPSLDPPYRTMLFDKTELYGGNVLAKFHNTRDGGGQHSIQFYTDYASRDDDWHNLKRLSFDIDYQHSFGINRKINIVWGGGYRLYSDDMREGLYTWLDPSKSKYWQANCFFQVDRAVIPEVLELTIGAKAEYHKLSDYEFLPNIRVLWHPAKKHTIWASAARAVRTPSRAEREGGIFLTSIPPLSSGNPEAIPIKVQFDGQENSKNEILYAYEMGYRIAMHRNLTIDLATFYNKYKDLLGTLPSFPIADENYPEYLLLPLLITNMGSIDTYGFELAIATSPVRNTSIKFSYSYINNSERINAVQESGHLDAFEQIGPRHKFTLITNSNIGQAVNIGAVLRYVDEIRSLMIEDYLTADLKLSWRIIPQLEIALSGLDLLEKEHVEYISETGRVGSSVERRFQFDLNFKI